MSWGGWEMRNHTPVAVAMTKDGGPMPISRREVLSHWTSSSWYLLFVIALVTVHQFTVQYLFSVAVEPIKAEFHLSDSQLGAINGPAFLVFFGIAGIPIAHLAERIGRRQVIAGSVAVWSAFTAITALASGFFTLFGTRALVGIGQAGSLPAVQSLIAARFPPEKRSGAMAVMSTSLYLGLFFALALGSVLVRALGWRGAFLVTGATGALLVPLVWLTLRDPPLPTHAVKETVLRNAAAVLRTGGMFHYLAMYGLLSLTAAGTYAWTPAFYERYYGMDTAQAGTFGGLVLGGGSLVASGLGGIILNRLGRAGEDSGSSFMLWCTFRPSRPVSVRFLYTTA